MNRVVGLLDLIDGLRLKELAAFERSAVQERDHQAAHYARNAFGLISAARRFELREEILRNVCADVLTGCLLDQITQRRSVDLMRQHLTEPVFIERKLALFDKLHRRELDKEVRIEAVAEFRIGRDTAAEILRDNEPVFLHGNQSDAAEFRRPSSP